MQGLCEYQRSTNGTSHCGKDPAYLSRCPYKAASHLNAFPCPIYTGEMSPVKSTFVEALLRLRMAPKRLPISVDEVAASSALAEIIEQSRPGFNIVTPQIPGWTPQFRAPVEDPAEVLARLERSN